MSSVSELILPGARRTAQATGLTVIGRADKPPAFRCRLCKGAWTEDEHSAYMAHVKACSDYHDDVIQKLRPSHRAPGIYGMENEGGEMHRWVQEHGRMPRDNSRATRRKRAREDRKRRGNDG